MGAKMTDDENSKTLRGEQAAQAAKALEPSARDIGTPESHRHGATVVKFFKPGKGRDYAMRLDAIWRMVDKGIIEERHAKAADKFNLHFERAALGEHYQTINLFRVTGGIGDFTDDQMFHREQARRGLAGQGPGGVGGVACGGGQEFHIELVPGALRAHAQPGRDGASAGRVGPPGRGIRDRLLTAIW